MGFGKKPEKVEIKPSNVLQTTISIYGITPLVQHKFSEKARKIMEEAMTRPPEQQGRRKVRQPRDFNQEYEDAQHKSEDGWVGIPCSAFRNAMIDSCRTLGLPMTKAKMAIFVLPDGLSEDDGTPLVRVYSKKGPEKHACHVRLETGVADIRVRPMWREWTCKVTIKFDADVLTGAEVANMLDKAGEFVGVGEGRNFSKNSAGMGWGSFKVQQGVSDVKGKKRATKAS